MNLSPRHSQIIASTILFRWSFTQLEKARPLEVDDIKMQVFLHSLAILFEYVISPKMALLHGTNEQAKKEESPYLALANCSELGSPN
jgi:hypothetical protein